MNRQRWIAYFSVGLLTANVIVFPVGTSFAQQQTAATNNSLVAGQAQTVQQPNLASTTSFYPQLNQLANNPFAGGDFQSCVQNSQITNSIDTALGALGGVVGTLYEDVGNVSGTTVCKDPFKPTKEPVSCDNYIDSEGKFNKSAWNKAKRSLKDQVAYGKCKISRLESASKKSKCLQKELTRIKAVIDKNKSSIEDYRGQSEKFISKIREKAQFEEKKITALQGELQQFSAARELAESTLEEVDGVAQPGSPSTSASISDLKKRQQEYSQKVSAFKLERAQEQIARSVNCLFSAGADSSNYKACQKADGGLYSGPVDCLYSIYYDRKLRELAGDRAIYGAAEKRKAEIAMNLLKDSVERAFRDVRNFNFKLGATMSPAAIKKRLARFGKEGEALGDELNKCSIQTKTEIDQELASHTGSLGTQFMALKEVETTLSSEASNFNNKLNRAIRSTWRAFYKRDLSDRFNPRACVVNATIENDSAKFNNVGLDKQMQCLQGMTENLHAMIDGTPLVGGEVPLTIPIQVPGAPADKQTNCKGLNDCITIAGTLFSEAQARKTDMEGQGTFTDTTNELQCPNNQCPGIEKFKAEANQAVEGAVRQIAQAFESQIASFNAVRDQLEEVLDGEGLELGRTVKGVKRKFSCPPPSGGDKVCELPDDFGELVAAMAGIGTFDEDFSGVSAKAKSKEETYSDAITEVNTNLKEVESLAGKCKKEAAKAIREKEREVTTQLTSAKSALDSILMLCQLNAKNPKFDPAQCSSRVSDIINSILEICSVTAESNSGCIKAKADADSMKLQCENCAKQSDELAKVIDDPRAAPAATNPEAQGVGSEQPSNNSGTNNGNQQVPSNGARNPQSTSGSSSYKARHPSSLLPFVDKLKTYQHSDAPKSESGSNNSSRAINSKTLYPHPPRVKNLQRTDDVYLRSR